MTTPWRRALTARCRSFAGAEHGSAMVEFAIGAGVFTFLLVGIMETGMAVWEKNTAAADAREGARWASVRGFRSGSEATPDLVRDYVKSRTTLPKTGPYGIRVYTVWPDIPCPEPCKSPGHPVWVSVARNVPRRGPFIPEHTDSVTSKMIIVF